MTGYGDKYVIDNNVLSQLKRHQRASDFFRLNCHIPSEVLYEARFFPDIGELSDIEYPVTSCVLGILIEVMATVPITDTKLVDLYANRGNADPLVVACAVDGQRKSEEGLFGPAWVVVSGDRAVQAKSVEFGIGVMGSENFISILEEEISKEARGVTE